MAELTDVDLSVNPIFTNKSESSSPMATTASERAERAGPSTREARLCRAGVDGLRGEPTRGVTPS